MELRNLGLEAICEMNRLREQLMWAFNGASIIPDMFIEILQQEGYGFIVKDCEQRNNIVDETYRMVLKAERINL